MARPDRRSRYLSAIPRFLRWNPVNYWQVWLVCAVPLFLIWAIGYLALGKSLLGLELGILIALVNGAGQSYRLHLRREEADTAEGTPDRPGPPTRVRKR